MLLQQIFLQFHYAEKVFSLPQTFEYYILNGLCFDFDYFSSNILERILVFARMKVVHNFLVFFTFMNIFTDETEGYVEEKYAEGKAKNENYISTLFLNFMGTNFLSSIFVFQWKIWSYEVL